MGAEFTNLDFDTADAINTVEFMKMANHHLGYEGSDADGNPYNTESAVQWLTGDQAGWRDGGYAEEFVWVQMDAPPEAPHQGPP